MSSLKVQYPIGLVAKNSKQFTKKNVTMEPAVYFTGEPNVFYTLVMVDPQANPRAKNNTKPTEEYFHSYLHWLITNIPSTFDLSLGTVVQEYTPPTPPSSKNRPNLRPTHFYYFQLYKQPQQLMVDKTRYLEKPDSHMFNLSQFTQENNLQLVAEVKMAITS